MVSCSSAPPLNMFTSPKRPELPSASFMHWFTFSKLTPGTGTCCPSRKSTMMPSVNNSFFRRSGV